MTEQELLLEIAQMFAKRRCGGQVFMNGKHNPTPTEEKLAKQIFDMCLDYFEETLT